MQVIQVDFRNPEDGAIIGKPQFTKADSHREAVVLALDMFGEDRVTLQEIKLLSPGDRILAGATTAWRYSYQIQVDLGEGEGERYLTALLFATYREKDEMGKPFDTYIQRDDLMVKLAKGENHDDL
ncbi:MAG TPA: hypothetical protein VNV63_06740 [Nitrospiria bacterium]|jgi:hypothetical protein|nr:hypothetical protein [Nitrospiria bacterium]